VKITADRWSISACRCGRWGIHGSSTVAVLTARLARKSADTNCPGHTRQLYEDFRHEKHSCRRPWSRL